METSKFYSISFSISFIAIFLLKISVLFSLFYTEPRQIHKSDKDQFPAYWTHPDQW